jgi:hypothetical protein
MRRMLFLLGKDHGRATAPNLDDQRHGLKRYAAAPERAPPARRSPVGRASFGVAT